VNGAHFPVPRVYLAGKIYKQCWRHLLVPALRHQEWSDGPIATPDFIYVGPYFVSCDHGCRHGPAIHGAATPPWRTCGHPEQLARSEVLQRCLALVRQCDVLFAYINARDCYGTISEIEQALMQQKYVVLAFAPGFASPSENDFWFTADRAQRCFFDVKEQDLKVVLIKSLKAAARSCNLVWTT
jgi:hypothetical protein